MSAGLIALLAAGAIAAAGLAAAPTASVRIDGAAAGDRAGTAIAAAGDFDGDGRADVIVGAPGALRNPDGTTGGAAYVLFGPFSPGGPAIDLADLQGRGIVLRGSPAAGGEMAGQSVAGAGDVNGDGLADVIVGAPGATPEDEGTQTRPGRAYIVFGTRAPHDLDLDALGPAGITLTGARFQFPDAFGWQVAGIGDVDRDGLGDVAIAAPGNPGFESESTPGSAYVVFGRRSAGTIAMARLGTRGFRAGPAPVTAVAAAGDWNRDRRADIAVSTARAVYIVYGRRYRRPVRLPHLRIANGVTIRSDQPRALEGAALAGGQDVTGDRRPDLVIGTPQAHYFGLGPANGGAWLVTGRHRAWETAIGAHGWLAGSAVALGRVDGDRRADTVMIAHGSVAVLYGGPTRPRVRLDTLPAARGLLLDGTAEPAPPGSPAGAGGYTSVAAGDLDADGRAELLAGAPFAAHEGRANAGSVYVLTVR